MNQRQLQPELNPNFPSCLIREVKSLVTSYLWLKALLATTLKTSRLSDAIIPDLVLLLLLQKIFNHLLSNFPSLILGSRTFSGNYFILQNCGGFMKGELIAAEKRTALDQGAFW